MNQKPRPEVFSHIRHPAATDTECYRDLLRVPTKVPTVRCRNDGRIIRSPAGRDPTQTPQPPASNCDDPCLSAHQQKKIFRVADGNDRENESSRACSRDKEKPARGTRALGGH